MNDTLAWVGAIGGIFGGIAGIGGAAFAWMEWQKINRKIAMIADPTRAAEILPAWYTDRMMTDYWLFGLWTVSGQMVAITRITGVSDDGEWIDVDLANKDELAMRDDDEGRIIYCVTGDRPAASVKISNIVAAMEIRTS